MAIVSTNWLIEEHIEMIEVRDRNRHLLGMWDALRKTMHIKKGSKEISFPLMPGNTMTFSNGNELTEVFISQDGILETRTR